MLYGRRVTLQDLAEELHWKLLSNMFSLNEPLTNVKMVLYPRPFGPGFTTNDDKPIRLISLNLNVLFSLKCGK